MIDFLSSFPYAAATRRTYISILSRFSAEVADPHTLTAGGLLAFIDKPEWGNSRQCVALACLQKYLAWKYGGTHPALAARLKRVTGKPQRALCFNTAIQLLASFDPFTAKGARDLAICALALDTGLRVSELCRLQQADTDTEHRVLQVIVKGGQWSAAVFSPQTAAHIEHWKRYRETVHPKGYLFVNIQKGTGLTSEGLRKIVVEWGRKINIQLTPHDLRRTFAVLATECGAPERVLMAGGRWSTSEMLNRYTRTLKLDAMRKYLPMNNLEPQA
jgi:integrase